MYLQFDSLIARLVYLKQYNFGSLFFQQKITLLKKFLHLQKNDFRKKLL